MSDNVPQVESGKAVKLKLESIKYGEELIEALDIADEFKAKVEQYAMQLEDYKAKKEDAMMPERPKPDPIIVESHNVFDFVLSRLKNIPRADLESTLKFLPYSYVERFLYYLEHFVRREKEPELVIKCLYLILRSYEAQLATSQSVVRIIYSLNVFARSKLQSYKVKFGVL